MTKMANGMATNVATTEMEKRSRAMKYSRKNPMTRGIGILYAVVTAVMLLGAFPAPARAQESSHGESHKAVQRMNRAPVNKDILRVHLDQPSVRKLANGLTVLVLERHELPTVNYSMWIRPGALADPPNQPGLSSMVAEMLREGTANRSSAQVSKEVDSLGATLDASARAQSSHATVSASGLTNSTERLMDLMADIVLHPSFPDDELAKYKRRELATLEEDRAEPRFLGNERLSKVIYGDFPASVVAPTPASVDSVTRENLRAFHAEHYRPGNAILGIAGDVNTAEVLAMVEKYFGGWQGTASDQPALGPVPAAAPAAIYLVDRPGSVQTNLLAGDYSLERTSPDYPALTVMNRVLGDGTSSRLFLNLREEKGYTYGAYSYFNADIYPGIWRAQTEVRNAVTDGSMHELMYELTRIQTDPVPAQELGEAERAIIASFALSLENPQEVLNAWLTVQYYGLPKDYWDQYTDLIGKVTAEQVQAAARKYIDLTHLQIVAVGDAKQVKTALDKYGKVQVFDATGKPQGD
jgi:zinc protease